MKTLQNIHKILGVLVFCLIFSLTVFGQTPVQPPGNGTDANPFEISTLDHLAWFMNGPTGKVYVLQNDIDATDTENWYGGQGWNPKVFGSNSVFDGNGYVISNLTINRPNSSYVGFIGRMYNYSKVKNLGLTNIDITGRIFVGGIVGFSDRSTVYNSYTTGEVYGYYEVGGLIGYSRYSGNLQTGSGQVPPSEWNNPPATPTLEAVANSFSECNVYGEGEVGGLVGLTFQANIYNSYSLGDLSENPNISGPGGYLIGGMVGFLYSSRIYNAYSRGDVSGRNYVGGLIGRSYVSYVYDTYSTGQVTSTYNPKGGLIGQRSGGQIITSFWDKQTSGMATSYGGTPKTTAEMTTQTTFTSAGWDFDGETPNGTYDIWTIGTANDGYPYFDYQIPPNGPPVAVCQNVVTSADGNCQDAITAAADFDDGSTDPDDDPLTFTVDVAGPYPLGVTDIVLTVTDDSGAFSTCDATITVNDVTPPVPDLDPLEDASGECSVTVTAPTATDNCAGALTATTTNPLIYDAQGSYTVTWTYDDGNGNIYTQTQTVVVDDVTAPIADVDPLPDAIGECDVMLTAPTATDNCAGALTAATSDPLTYDTQGSYTVTWTFDDGNENTYTQTQTVIVDDVTPPVITVECPVSIELCGDQTVTWIEPQATDNCPGMTTSSTHTPGDMFTFGTTTVTYTFTDIGNNVSECSFDITIRAYPEVNVTQNTVPDFCQGLILLEAAVNNTNDLLMPLEYTWAGLPDDDFDAIVTTNGTYNLSVEDGNNCVTMVATVVDEVPSDAVSAYVMIASKELNIEETTVTGGGIGVMQAGKKAKVKKNSVINSFVKADVIDKDATTTIDTEILGQVDVTLPPFYPYDDNCDGEDITVAKNETMTLYGEVYGKINVKENATLIFDSPELYIEDLDTKKDAKIEFLQSSNVMVKKEIKIDKNNEVNANGYSVTFYVEKQVDIKEGTVFNANIFAEKDIKVEGKANNFTLMTGMFISLEKIHSKKYVDWFASDVCDSAPIPDGTSCYSQMIVATWETNTDLLVYPNPTSGLFNIELYANNEVEVKIVVTDILGSVKLMKETSLVRGENVIDLDISQLISGTYFIKMRSATAERTTSVILINK